MTVSAASISGRKAVALIGDGAERELSPGGRDLGDFEAVANGEALFVPVLIGEDIVGDGHTNRATGGDA
jgi:hypothetical protein